MPTYKVDERDVQFNLFEYLNIGALSEYERFKDYNEEVYKMVVTEALKFAKNELDPLYVSGDREQCQINDGVVSAPKGYLEAYKKMGENGFIGIDTPVTYGGQGLPVAMATAVGEFMIGANVAFSLYSGLTRGSSYLIENFGTEELAKRYCEKMYNGTWTGTMCLTEPQAGTAVGEVKTVAKLNDDGTYNVVGNKLFITGGDHNLTENIIHLVLARVEGDAPGTKGLSLFIIPKVWVNDDGSLGDSNDVNCVNIEHKMGIKASATCTLNFGENGKCRGYLLGEQTKGMRIMFKLMNEARLMTGMQGMAIAGSAYENSLTFAKERIQGGDTAIVDYPDVRRNLTLSRAYAEGMRALLYYTGKCIDLSEVHPDEEQREYYLNRVDLLTPICKAYCTDVGFKVTELAIQIHGGYGYCSEYPVEQHMRDVKIASLYEGTNGVQAMDLMGRKLALKNGQLFREYYEEVTKFATQHEGHATLSTEIASLKKAMDTVAQVAMKIAEWGMGGDKEKCLMSATPFLELCGHATLGYLLLDQAVLAAKTIADGKDEAFYRNKVRTAKFFAYHIMPGVQMRAKEILSEDMSAMEMEY